MDDSSGSQDLWHGTLSAHRTQTAGVILHAAIRIISSEGIAGLSMSALADAAGISRQTLYKYFPDIDAVLAGMATAGAAGMAELADRIEAEEDPRDAVRLFVGAVLEAALAGHPSPLALAAAVPASSREVMREHERSAEAMVIGLVTRGRDSGVFRADVDPDVDGRLIYRAAFAASDLVLEPGADAAALTTRITDNLFRMVEKA